MTSEEAKSTVLVDAMALMRSLSCIHHDFTILEFLDLCTAIEAIVLNDRITILDSTPELINSQHEMLLLEAQGVFSHEDSGVKIADEEPALHKFRVTMNSLMNSGRLPRTPLGKTTFGDAFREATAISGAERRLQISALPLRRFSCFYEPKVLAREEHTACDLVANYDILSRDLRHGRGLYRFPLSDYIFAEIPPMPIIALNRSPDRERLIYVVLELREEYSSLRASLSQLRAVLSDVEVSPKEKQRQLRSWSKSWKTLDKYGPSTKLAMANTTLSAVGVNKSADGEHLDLDLNKLLSWVGKGAREGWYRWRVRILHDVAKQYLRTSDGAISRETQRLFSHELSADDLRQLRDWDAQMASLGGVADNAPSRTDVSVKMASKKAAAAASDVLRMTTSDIHPPDLEMRVRLVSEDNQARLFYTLYFTTGVAPFTHLEIEGPRIMADSQRFPAYLRKKLDQLVDGRDVGDEKLLLHTDIQHKLVSFGRQLWSELFSPQFLQVYRTIRGTVRTWMIVTDEPWIPWELVKPYDDSTPESVIDDDFLGRQFQLTRWLEGSKPPSLEIEIHGLAAIRTEETLSQGEPEGEHLAELALRSGVVDASLSAETLSDLLAFLEKGGVHLLHFIGHGSFDAGQADESPIPLLKGAPLRPNDLEGPVKTRISQDRPLVFLNACWGGQQGWSITRTGGWAARWVRECGCGAFIAPLWPVHDQPAAAFARVFYEALWWGETLGQAAQEAREHLRETQPQWDPSVLAYIVYGNPNARVLFTCAQRTMPA